MEACDAASQALQGRPRRLRLLRRPPGRRNTWRCSIVVPGRKSNWNSAGRIAAGVSANRRSDFEMLPTRIRPKSVPEACFPGRKHYVGNQSSSKNRSGNLALPCWEKGPNSKFRFLKLGCALGGFRGRGGRSEWGQNPMPSCSQSQTPHSPKSGSQG